MIEIRSFSDIFEKARMLSYDVIILPEFAASNLVFREVIGTSVKNIKENELLGG